MSLLKNINFKEDWRTTVSGIVSGLLIVAGILWPDKVSVEDQANLNVAVGSILTGTGTIVLFITSLLAKDPQPE